MLPARQGDALWLRWGEGDVPYQLLIDLGTEEVGRAFYKKLKSLPAAERKFELLVVSHVDQDHIGGVLTGIAESDPLDGFDIGDVWFNGWEHLSGGMVNQPGSNKLEAFGPPQGERLASFLRSYNWNAAFNGKSVMRSIDKPLLSVTLTGGLKLTVLGPTPNRLNAFKKTWKEEVLKALEKGKLKEVSPGLEAYGSNRKPELNTIEDLRKLAEKDTSTDSSYANGSSIALLLEYDEVKVLLAGDAFGDDIVDGLRAYSHNDKPVPLDAIKLPHHGSKKNITETLVNSIKCDNWLFSTDGTRFKHPDSVSVARVIYANINQNPVLHFNVFSDYNKWWDNHEWCQMFGYTTRYGNKANGLSLTL